MPAAKSNSCSRPISSPKVAIRVSPSPLARPPFSLGSILPRSTFAPGFTTWENAMLLRDLRQFVLEDVDGIDRLRIDAIHPGEVERDEVAEEG